MLLPDNTFLSSVQNMLSDKVQADVHIERNMLHPERISEICALHMFILWW